MAQRLSSEIISDSKAEILRKAQPVSLEVIEISSDDDSDDLLTKDGARRAQYTTAGGITHTGSFCAPEIIELTDSDAYDTSSDFPDQLTGLVKSPGKVPGSITKKLVAQAPKEFLPLFVDESDADDGSILVLNEPRSTRKPIRRARIPEISPSFPSARHDPKPTNTHFSGEDTRQPGVTQRPQEHVDSAKTRTDKLPSSMSARGKAEEQARREKYAEKLFAELNSTIFDDGLPRETKLNWNKRLLTTAGRARWHKSRDGVQTTEIELAAKILDRDERIRNTLSHEMCHLACWIINGDPKEGHGPAFKAWANKVMTIRPEIEITVGMHWTGLLFSDLRNLRQDITTKFYTHLNGNVKSVQKYMGDIANPLDQTNAYVAVVKLENSSPSSRKELPGPRKSAEWQLLYLKVRTALYCVIETTQILTNSTVYDISSEDEVNILVGAIKNVTLHEYDTLP
ncbi:hypothetical protein AZE42_00861 [Rhizopogon vesiculosus]|uniref:SprT-like domain-containing protein n=1 Tax=Rhizopogon vesiculosus TaxID=180088 RepID=A0A1J8R4H2_9AGAM|nr:hypothetical protein AZE42_00861 [Rhizopogon vesiculosus]